MKSKKIKKRRVSKSEYFINISVTLVLVLFGVFFLFVPKVSLNAPLKEIVNINKKVDETISLPASKINESKIINNIEKNEVNNAETNSNENDSISIEKTNDILKQINEYLDKEKSKLNKGE